jgi:hypothetical protein
LEIEADAVEKRDRTGSHIGLVTGIAAIAAGAVYFVGWQYKLSLALAFGLPNYPGDLSFQGTVAAGVAVFDSKLTVWVAVVLAVAWIALSLLEKIPVGILALVSCFRLHRVNHRKALRRAKKELSTLKEDFEIRANCDDVRLSELEKSARRLHWKDRLLSWSLRMLRSLRKLSPLSVVIGHLVIAALVIFAPIAFFFAGHYVARTDAIEIKADALGSCSACFTYEMTNGVIVGVPVFQNDDAIFIQHKRSLVRVGLTSLKAIGPHVKDDGVRLHLPRR